MSNEKYSEEVITVMKPFEYHADLREHAVKFMVQRFTVPTGETISDRLIEAAMFIICGVAWVQPQCIAVATDYLEEPKSEQTGEQKEGTV